MRDGWIKRPLGEIVTLQRGFDLPASKRTAGPYPVVSSGGISGWHNKAMSAAPGVVMGRYGTIGEIHFIGSDYWPLNTTLWIADFHGNDHLYVYYLLSSLDFSAFKDKTGVPGVNRNDLHKIQVPVAPRSMQLRIAKILRTWDEAIEKTERLIAAKESLFKRSREELSWDHRRSQFVQLGELLTQRSQRVGPGRDIRVYSVTKDGLIPQDEHFNKRISNEDVSRHMLVEQGDFALSGLNFWLGSVDVSLDPEPFCISPDYKVFRLGAQVVPEFFRHIVRTCHFQRILRCCAVERASVVRKNFDRHTFLASEIPLPDPERQKAILKVLSTAEEELVLLRRQLGATQKQKRGLMQKLLTGEWPVSASELLEAAE